MCRVSFVFFMKYDFCTKMLLYLLEGKSFTYISWIT
jgi:hypothetical protein